MAAAIRSSGGEVPSVPGALLHAMRGELVVESSDAAAKLAESGHAPSVVDGANDELLDVSGEWSEQAAALRDEANAAKAEAEADPEAKDLLS